MQRTHRRLFTQLCFKKSIFVSTVFQHFPNTTGPFSPGDLETPGPNHAFSDTNYRCQTYIEGKIEIPVSHERLVTIKGKHREAKTILQRPGHYHRNNRNANARMHAYTPNGACIGCLMHAFSTTMTVAAVNDERERVWRDLESRTSQVGSAAASHFLEIPTLTRARARIRPILRRTPQMKNYST
jgi:hypothetical protein